MPRYVAFLRGVRPMNAKMAELRRSFEQAGFADVKTVTSKMKRQIAAFVLAVVALPAAGADPDPCRLVTPAEIAAALGVQPAKGKAGGPRVEQGVKVWHCDRQVGRYYLSVNAYEFPLPAAAKSGLAEALAEAKDTVELGPATGVGEAAAWGAPTRMEPSGSRSRADAWLT